MSDFLEDQVYERMGEWYRNQGVIANRQTIQQYWKDVHGLDVVDTSSDQITSTDLQQCYQAVEDAAVATANAVATMIVIKSHYLAAAADINDPAIDQQERESIELYIGDLVNAYLKLSHDVVSFVDGDLNISKIDRLRRVK